MAELKYDSVCHCGISLSTHSKYDNHPFTEMDTWESMNSKIEDLRAQLAASQARECRMLQTLRLYANHASWYSNEENAHNTWCGANPLGATDGWIDAEVALSTSQPCPHKGEVDVTVQTQTRADAGANFGSGATEAKEDHSDAIASGAEKKESRLVCGHEVCRHCGMPEMNCDCADPFEPAARDDSATPCPHAAEAERLKLAINFIANLTTAYWIKPQNGHGWRLIETDCGAMRECSEGDTPLDAAFKAMDAARLREAEKGGGR